MPEARPRVPNRDQHCSRPCQGQRLPFGTRAEKVSNSDEGSVEQNPCDQRKECIFFGATSGGSISMRFLSKVDVRAESYTEKAFSVCLFNYLFH